MMSVTSAEYVEGGAIHAEIDGRWLIVPNDPGNRHRAAIAVWETAGNTIAPYVAPPPPVLATVSRLQFWAGLAAAGLVSEAEAESMVAEKTIPASIAAFIAGLPSEDQFVARMALKGATEFERGNGLIEAYATGAGLSSGDLDDLFGQMAAIAV